MRHTIALLIIYSFCSCSSPRAREKNTSRAQAVRDTVVINARAALLYYPDTSLIQKEIRETGSADFVDDNMFYMASARKFLDSMNVKVIEVEDDWIVKFIRQDGHAIIIQKETKDTILAWWGVYLFDPIKVPIAIDITDINSEYKNYFQ